MPLDTVIDDADAVVAVQSPAHTLLAAAELVRDVYVRLPPVGVPNEWLLSSVMHLTTRISPTTGVNDGVTRAVVFCAVAATKYDAVSVGVTYAPPAKSFAKVRKS